MVCELDDYLLALNISAEGVSCGCICNKWATTLMHEGAVLNAQFCFKLYTVSVILTFRCRLPSSDRLHWQNLECRATGAIASAARRRSQGWSSWWGRLPAPSPASHQTTPQYPPPWKWGEENTDQYETEGYVDDIGHRVGVIEEQMEKRNYSQIYEFITRGLVLYWGVKWMHLLANGLR